MGRLCLHSLAPIGYLFSCDYHSLKDFSGYGFCLVAERAAFVCHYESHCQSRANEGRDWTSCHSRLRTFHHRRIALGVRQEEQSQCCDSAFDAHLPLPPLILLSDLRQKFLIDDF